MLKGLESLASMKYPGRLIIIGIDKTGENHIVIYAITGRSAASKARKLVIERGTVWTKPTDEAVLRKGNIKLLVYPAIYINKGIAVSNGRQTEDIKEHLTRSKDPVEVLLYSQKHWDYEPDRPNFTPRISGCILPHKKAALSIIKRASDGSSIKHVFEIPLLAGRGKMIATYKGENREPLSSFQGEPLDVELEGKKAEEMAELVYQALASKNKKKDFRIAVACVFSRNIVQKEFDIYIINRHERTKNRT